MQLEELLNGVRITRFPEGIQGELRVAGITTDSGKVRPGDAFICIRGGHTDGHLYAADAVARGAAAIIAEEPLEMPVPVIVAENTRKAAAFMWSNRYNSPAKEMTVTAITGTNGKTSVAFMLRRILQDAGFRSGIIGTVMCAAGDHILDVGGGSEIPGASAAMTTPDPEFLYGLLYEMRLRGVTHVVMEASSHALSQHKLDPISADVAVFTGLSPEHLDHHGTMENYLAAKSALFRTAGRGIINWDDPYAMRLTEAVSCDWMKVGADPDRVEEYDVYAGGIRSGRGSVKYRLRPYRRTVIRCLMPGRFGVYNSLLAASAALQLGVPPKEIAAALAKFPGVPGRMETVATLGRLRVIRDYAHTPDALRGALEIASGDKGGGRLWLLFGCGGDRDPSKRPEMARIAAELADHTVITSDNCRTENRHSIIEDILAGFDKTKPHTVIPDREEAIRYAIANAGGGDTILLCGKGHEDYEITAEGKRPFDEAAIARSAIDERRLRKKRRK